MTKDNMQYTGTDWRPRKEKVAKSFFRLYPLLFITGTPKHFLDTFVVCKALLRNEVCV